MLRLGTIVMGAADVRRAAEFWGRALGYVPRDGAVDEGWTVLVPADGQGPAIALGRSTSPVQEKPRVHLDLYVDDRAEQEAEVARLTGLGAERVDWELYPEDPDFVVLADPEGNRFCVIDASHTAAD
ncbi:VOC family protein [Streptomyces sp. SID2999]|uniref:VOC family protein n=1 Tax=Streptomyces sp. SID2999 TaxID=2690258 RepID=UPI00136FD020|nr:VOC family protein [Streptomyces sp. SID2999]MYZ09727.1 VOC family protein [Streptomyces sp. SID2999]